MDTTLYVALSHQTAMRRRLDVIANNLANMDTTGYKKEQVLFYEYLKQADSDLPRSAQKVAMVQDYGTYRNVVQGELTPTGNTLDVAIQGDGFLMAQHRETGEFLYTRAGSLAVNEEGNLVASGRHNILDVDGRSIEISDDDLDLTISSDGTISSSLGPVGQLAVVTFQNQQAMEKAGESMFRSEEPPVPAEGAIVNQGMIEGSNVNPILEVTQMIDVLRTYQSVAGILQKYQDMRKDGINRLGRLQ